MGTIVLLRDLIDQRQRKQEELSRYTKNLESLRVKLDYLRKEIALTERIIAMVKTEEIVEIRPDAE